MILPENIDVINALEVDLESCGFEPDDYLPMTTQMKNMLHTQYHDPLHEYESLMRTELEKIFELIKSCSL